MHQQNKKTQNTKEANLYHVPAQLLHIFLRLGESISWNKGYQSAPGASGCCANRLWVLSSVYRDESLN